MPGFELIADRVRKMLVPMVKKFGHAQPYYYGKHYTLGGHPLDLDKIQGGPEIMKFINDNIESYWKELNYRGNPRIKHIWVNVIEPGGTVTIHDHAPIAAVGCFYVAVEENSGSLYVSHPDELLLRHQPYDEEYIKKCNYSFDHEFKPGPGTLILFPGYVRHRTGVNETAKDRVMIGFNVVAEDCD